MTVPRRRELVLTPLRVLVGARFPSHALRSKRLNVHWRRSIWVSDGPGAWREAWYSPEPSSGNREVAYNRRVALVAQGIEHWPPEPGA